MTRTLIEVDRERLEWQHKRNVTEAQFRIAIRHISEPAITGYRTVIADCDAKISELSEELKEIKKPN